MSENTAETSPKSAVEPSGMAESTTGIPESAEGDSAPDAVDVDALRADLERAQYERDVSRNDIFYALALEEGLRPMEMRQYFDLDDFVGEDGWVDRKALRQALNDKAAELGITTDDSEVDEDTLVRRNAEAAKFRRRAREAEKLLDDTRNVLNQERQRIIHSAVWTHGITPALANAAGITPESVLGEDGLLDAGKIDAAARKAAIDFNTQPPSRRPAPNPVAGHSSSGYRESSPSRVWDSAFGLTD